VLRSRTRVRYLIPEIAQFSRRPQCDVFGIVALSGDLSRKGRLKESAAINPSRHSGITAGPGASLARKTVNDRVGRRTCECTDCQHMRMHEQAHF
jgi:hypothetical protein